MARKSRLVAGAGALVATLLLSVPSASAGIVIIGETPPEVNLIIAGEEGGLFVQHGEVGDTVQIDGHGFQGATAVNFGSTAASFTVQALGYEIEAVAPPGEGTVPVTVTTPGGTSKPSFGDYFTYVMPPPPTAPAPPTTQPSPPATLSAASAPAPPPSATESQPAAASPPAHSRPAKHRHHRKRHPAHKRHRHHHGKRRKRGRSAR
jgi:hypothetical protein